MPGIPSKDASFVWGTPRNYALTKKGTRGNEDINFYIGKTNLYITKDFAGKIVMIMVYCRPSIYNLQRR